MPIPIRSLITSTAPQFFSVDEAAIILNVSKKMVYRWIKEGKLPAFRVDGSPRSTRISRTALEHFIQQYTTTIQEATHGTTLHAAPENALTPEEENHP